MFRLISALLIFVRPSRDGKRCSTLPTPRLLLIRPTIPHAYFYAAGASFGLHRLPQAEKSALKVVEVDKTKREPRAHFLLAQIYEIEGKPDAEAAQLQEYLKSATDPQDVTMVKKYLADLAASHRK
jgi:hypothetical protein